MLDRLPFNEIWAADFEFVANSGERPIPVCMVARELRTGRQLRLWADQFGPRPPFNIGADALFVAYFASAEFSCFRVLNWPMPARILDIYVEYRNSTNTLQQKSRSRAAYWLPWPPTVSIALARSKRWGCAI